MMKYIPSSRRGCITFGLLLLLGLLQAVPRGPRNAGVNGGANSIGQGYGLPSGVAMVLKKACYDCHSNRTSYPWYSRVQPVAQYLDGHVRDGKSELNLDEFMTYSLRKRQHKLVSIREQVEEGQMPLSSYTWMHPEARLTPEERRLIAEWARQQETKGE